MLGGVVSCLVSFACDTSIEHSPGSPASTGGKCTSTAGSWLWPSPKPTFSLEFAHTGTFLSTFFRFSPCRVVLPEKNMESS